MKEREKNPEAVICLGDSAYSRSNIRGNIGLGVPVQLRKDGVQLKVTVMEFPWSMLDLLRCKGDDIKETHKVQSVRAKVEHVFADLKQAKVMFSNKIQRAEEFEGVLDCVIALHNLRVLLKVNPNFDIPLRRHPIEGEHVFRPFVPQKDVDLKIPADEPKLADPKYHHIRKFKEFLPSAISAVKKALERGGEGCVFFPVALVRGKNLYNGAYVLQLRVQDEGHDRWTIKYVVGASYSYELHHGYFQMDKGNPVLCHICDCYAG